MRRITPILLVCIVIAGIFYLIYYIPSSKYNSRVLSPLASNLSSPLLHYPAFLSTSSPTKPVHILLLGMDARKGDKKPRCDAIHILSFDHEKSSVIITSVPRGTLVATPNSSEQTYIGNACHSAGIPFTVDQIKKLTQIQPDFIVTIGFSQVLGIARMIGLPTTPTLQFLRSRAYGIGDYQRSYNQALFLKDMFVKHLDEVLKLPSPLQYLLFTMIDTDIDYTTAISILEMLQKSNIQKDPDAIVLVTKPSYPQNRKEIHFQEQNIANRSFASDPAYQSYQSDVAVYLQQIVKRSNLLLLQGNYEQTYNMIQIPFQQKLWLQIDDKRQRNLLYWQLLEVFVKSNPNKTSLHSLIHAFKIEMMASDEEELEKKADELRKELVS